MTDKIPAELDWVQARANCSLQSMFVQLQIDAQADVQRMNTLKSRPEISFELKTNDGTFSVVRSDETNPTPKIIRFNLRPDHI